MASVASQRYAAALYEVCANERCEDSTLEELKTVAFHISENPELMKIFAAPFIPKHERLDVVEKVFKGFLSQNVLNFIMLLTDKGRISEFSNIFKEFTIIYNDAHNIGDALVTSAVELSAEIKHKIAGKLSEITGKNISIKCNIDTSILGGIVVDINGERIDSSVRTRINTIARSIAEN